MPSEAYELSPNELKLYLSHFFGFIFRSVRFMAGVAKKRFLWLLAIAVVSGSVAYVIFSGYSKQYVYRMSCIYNDNHPRVYGEMLSQLDLLLQNKDYGVAGQYLGMTDEQLKKIVSVKGKTLAMGKLEEDYAGNKTPFYVEVKLEDASLVPVVQKQLMVYLNQNEFSTRSVQRQQAKWKTRSIFYEQQLAKLDSLKDVIRQSYLNNNNQVNMAQQNNSIVDIYKLSDSLSFFLADIQYYMNHYESVQLNYGLKLVSSHSPAAKLKKALLWAGICALIGWLLLAFYDLGSRQQHSL